MEIFWSRVGWWTESKAFEKSIAIAAVRVAGLFWLNPVAIAEVRGSSAVEVEWRERNPCCVWFGERTALRVARRRRSNTLEPAHRREIGR